MTRTTPEDPQETASAGSSETIRRPSRKLRDEEMVRSSRRREEVGRNDRPANRGFVPSGWSSSNSFSEIPCRVDELPSEGVISQTNPADNGEALVRQERVIPWEVESPQLFDPVTTEVERPRWHSLRTCKSMNAITRRPSSSGYIHLPSYVSGYIDGEGCFCVSLRPLEVKR